MRFKMLVSSLLDTIYNNLRSLVIGKLYTSADLAYYNQGRKFPNLIVVNINVSIDSVLLPAMSCVQDDRERVKSLTRRAIKVSTFLMAPMMMGLLFCAEPIVKLILTEKWLPCVSFMRIFCITYLFYPIHTANLNAITAMGRSDLFLKLETVKKAYGLVLLVSTMFISVKVMAYSLLVSTFLSMLVNSWPNKKLLDYSFWEQMKDIFPSILLSVAMGVCVYLVGTFMPPTILTLVIQIVTGAVLYFTGAMLLQLEPFEYLLEILLQYIKRSKE